MFWPATDRFPLTMSSYGTACAPMTMESNSQMATTRDLLDTAARWVADHQRVSVREAKARVHAMPLPELVAIAPVRRMLHEAARTVA